MKNIEDKILRDIEIEKETAWLRTNISGMDFGEHIFFALFGDDGKPLIQVDQRVRKNKKKTLRKPGTFNEDRHHSEWILNLRPRRC